MPALVRYPAFREFEAWRVAVNDSIEALFASTRIAEHHLSGRHDTDPNLMIPDVYPDLLRAPMMRVTLAVGARRVRDAEHHLATMSIPAIIAVYNESLVDASRIIDLEDVEPATSDPKRKKLGELRSDLAEARWLVDRGTESLVDFVIELRNELVHYGGAIQPQLRERWQAVAHGGKNVWTDIAGAPPLDQHERMRLGYDEIRAVLAATQRSIRDLNHVLGVRIGRGTWTRIAVDDWLATSDSALPAERDRAVQKLRGYARIHYGPLSLSDQEFDDELESRGL